MNWLVQIMSKYENAQEEENVMNKTCTVRASISEKLVPLNDFRSC